MSRKNKNKKISSLITLSSLVSQAAYGIDLNSKVKNTDKRFFETLPSLEKTDGSHFGLSLGQSTNPLIFKRNNGEEVVLVEGVQFLEANYLQSFSDKFQLGVMIPTAKPFGVMTPLTEENFFLGDILIEPRYYITDNLLFIPVFYLPTGDFENQVGSKSGAYGAKLATEINGKNTKMAFQIGALFAPNDIQGEIDNTLRLQAGVGLDWQLSESFHWLSEMYLEKSKNNMPLEALTFLEYRKDNFGVRAGLGSGSIITTGSNEVKGMVGFTMNFGSSKKSEVINSDTGSNISRSNDSSSDSSVIEFNEVETKQKTSNEYYLGDEDSVNPPKSNREKGQDEVDVDALFENKIDSDLRRDPQSTYNNYVEKREYQALDKSDNFAYFMNLAKSLMDSSDLKKENYIVLKSPSEKKEKIIEKEIKKVFSNKENIKRLSERKNKSLAKIKYQEDRLNQSYEVLKYTVSQYMRAIKNNDLSEVEKQIIEMRWAKQVSIKRKNYLLELQKDYNKTYKVKNIISSDILKLVNNKEAKSLIKIVNKALKKDHSKLVIDIKKQKNKEKIVAIPESISFEDIKLEHKKENKEKINQVSLEKRKIKEIKEDKILKTFDTEVIFLAKNKINNSILLNVDKIKEDLRDAENKKIVKISPPIIRKEEMVKITYNKTLLNEYDKVLKDIDFNKKSLSQEIDKKDMLTTIIDFSDSDKVMTEIDKKNFAIKAISLSTNLKSTLESFSLSLADKIESLKKEKEKNAKALNNVLIKEKLLVASLKKENSIKKERVLVQEKITKVTKETILLNQDELDSDLSSSLSQIEMNMLKINNLQNVDYKISQSKRHDISIKKLENIFDKRKIGSSSLKEKILVEEKSIQKDLYELEKKEIEKYIVDLKSLKKENNDQENISKEILRNELYLVRLKESNRQKNIDLENKRLKENEIRLAEQKEILDLKKKELDLLELNNIKLKNKKPAAAGRVRVDTVTIDQNKAKKEVSVIEEINSKLLEEEAKLRKAKIEEEKLIVKNKEINEKENAISLELSKINSEIKEINKEQEKKQKTAKTIEKEISENKSSLKKEMSALEELILIKKNKLLIDMQNKEKAEKKIAKENKKEIEKNKIVDSELEQLNTQLKALENRNKLLKNEIEDLEKIEIKEELNSENYDQLNESIDVEDDSDFGTIYESEGGMRELTPDDY